MASSSARRPDVPRNLKSYFLCLLKKGPQWNVTGGNEDLMPQYLTYLRREIEARRCIFAGPVTDDGDIVATAILEAPNAEAASASANANPGVQSGHFVVELHPCFLPSLDAVQVQY
jgi:uncharacterized protein YciI